MQDTLTPVEDSVLEQGAHSGKRIIAHPAHSFERDLESILRYQNSPEYCPHCQVPYPRISRSRLHHPISRFLLRITRRRCFKCLECHKKFVVRSRKSRWQPRIYSGYRYEKKSGAGYLPY